MPEPTDIEEDPMTDDEREDFGYDDFKGDLPPISGPFSSVFCGVFEIRYEAIDATVGGLFGHRPDTHRHMIRGIAHYYVDSREVTQAEYERRLKEHEAKKASVIADLK